MGEGTLASKVAQKWTNLRVRASSPGYRVTFNDRAVTFATGSAYEASWFKRNRFNGNHRQLHEPVLTTVLERLSRRFTGVIDIGAHIGYFSILMASVPGQRVVAVELDPTNFKVLSGQVAAQPEDVRGRLTLVHAGIAGGDGSVRMPAQRTPSPMHRIGAGDAAGDTVEVPLMAVDQLLERCAVRPAIVKMDIEGFELVALKAASTLLAEVRPVVAVEIHPRFLADHGSTPAEIVTLMAAADYRMFAMDERRPRRISPLSEVTSFAFDDTSDVLFVPAENADALAIVRAIG